MSFTIKELSADVHAFFRKLISIGIDEDTPVTEVKRIRLLNIFCWIWHLRTLIELLNDNFDVKPLHLILSDLFIMLFVVITIQLLQYKGKFLAARIVFVSSIICITFLFARFIYANETHPNLNIEYYFMLVPGVSLIFFDNKKIIATFVVTAFFMMSAPFDGINTFVKEGYVKKEFGNFVMIFLYFGVFLMVNYFKSLNRKNEAALQRKTKELEELDKFKSQFFTNISHEIRTPLTLIKGEIDNLMDGKTSKEELRTIHNNATKQINAITLIVNTVMDLAKMDSSSFMLNTKLSNVSDLLRKIYLSFEGIFAQKNISLLLDSPNKDYFATIDPIFIERAINNILNNSLKYTEHGEVAIRVFRKKSNVNITISDTGIGIAQKYMPHIFNRFYQINNDINQAGGSGIGLSFSKEIINLHGGTIAVSSIENEGSKFTICLPMAEEQANLVAKTFVPKTKSLGKLNVNTIQSNIVFLIVDDNVDMRNYLKTILINYECIEASNGQEAIEKLKNNTVNFIITDYMMPKMNGLEFSKRLDELQIDIPVIMITAKTEMETKLEILKLGVKDYITKPFDKQELLIRINNLLQNYSEKLAYNSKSGLPTNINNPNDLHVKIESYLNSDVNYQELNQDLLCEKFHISKSSLYRQIKSKTGLTPKEFITEIRLQRAQRILNSTPDILLKQLALEVGFKHTSYFSKIFNKRFGYNPIKKFANNPT